MDSLECAAKREKVSASSIVADEGKRVIEEWEDRIKDSAETAHWGLHWVRGTFLWTVTSCFQLQVVEPMLVCGSMLTVYAVCALTTLY
jgi:hypothetical protein